MLHEPRTDQDVSKAITGAGDTLIALFFTSPTCGPCHALEPFLVAMSEKYKHVHFLKVDITALPRVAAIGQITGTPTVQFFQKGARIGSIVGPQTKPIEDFLQKHAATASASQETLTPQGHVDVAAHIQKSQLECLNQQTSHPVQALFDGNAATYLESDCDHELLITVPFDSLVKLHSLKITCDKPEQGPRSIKLFLNTHAMDFSEAQSAPGVQTIHIGKEDLVGDRLIPLKFVLFQKVHSVTLFVSENQDGEETTRINKLIFVGSPVLTTKMDEFKRVAGESGEAGH